MGLNFMDINPIHHLTSPLKGEEQNGEEQNKLAYMRLRRMTAPMANLGLTTLFSLGRSYGE